ncbi:MAG: helix-turn-helix transcriptional regulator [Alphaproteobacteria bacterium]|nr:helix-turn-helix transcriptional regulator [Alphaproteobacteria bacterium]
MPSVGVLWRTAAVDAAFERELVRVAAEHLAGDRGERAQLGDLHLRLTSMAGPQGPAVLVRAGGTEDVGVSPVLGLSATRRRIVSFAVQGATVGEIARALDRSPETVRTHLKHIYAHVGVGSRVELAEASRTPWL